MLIETVKFCLCSFLSSDIFANAISFLGLIVATITLIIGGIKVQEILIDFNKKKHNAVFGYYMNLQIFINRLIRLTINNQDKPLGNIYLLSSNEELRKKNSGCEKLALKLSDLSEKFLDYLSSTSEQIPAASNEAEANTWNELIEKLSTYLSDFQLFDSGVYLPNLNTEDAIITYCNDLNFISTSLLSIIDNSKKNFWNQLSANKDE